MLLPNVIHVITFLAVVIAPVPFLSYFILFAHTQVMLILILINVQYLQNFVFSLVKKLEWPKSLLVRFPPPNRKVPQANFPSPYPLTLYGKFWVKDHVC